MEEFLLGESFVLGFSINTTLSIYTTQVNAGTLTDYSAETDAEPGSSKDQEKLSSPANYPGKRKSSIIYTSIFS